MLRYIYVQCVKQCVLQYGTVIASGRNLSRPIGAHPLDALKQEMGAEASECVCVSPTNGHTHAKPLTSIDRFWDCPVDVLIGGAHRSVRQARQIAARCRWPEPAGQPAGRFFVLDENSIFFSPQARVVMTVLFFMTARGRESVYRLGKDY